MYIALLTQIKLEKNLANGDRSVERAGEEILSYEKLLQSKEYEIEQIKLSFNQLLEEKDEEIADINSDNKLLARNIESLNKELDC